MSDEDLRLNPYVGLRPFFDKDSLYFYGREQQTTELLAILREHRFLAVVGSSGSGKSSLVRAGLIPALVGGFLVRDRDRWRNVLIKPGDAPMANLAEGLIAAMKRPVEETAALEQKLRDDRAEAVVEFLRAHIDDRTNVFLLVDQFEEIFAFRGADDDGGDEKMSASHRKERARRRAEAAEFVDLLLRLAESRDLPVYVALTMRTDFLGECDLFFGLPEAFNRGRYLVPRLTREQLRDAVECPALLLGATVAPRLLDQVLNALGDRVDRLPVLQHALLRTWDIWHAAGRIGPIDLSHYWKAGGLEGALDQDAEQALKDLDHDATARIFKRLTDTDANQRSVRSPARISELVAASGQPEAVVKRILDEFEQQGRSFVHASPDGNPADPRVDISHESLIRQWRSLRTWVDEERVSRDTYRELVSRAIKKAAGNAALLHDPELGIVYRWRAKEKPTEGWARRYSRGNGDFATADAYLNESVSARSRELAELELDRHWRRKWAPAIALIAVGLLVWLAPDGFRPLLTPSGEQETAKVAPATVRVRDLIWTTNDRQQALEWKKANDGCEALDVPLEPGGEPFDGWRLPSTSELADIYSPADADGLGRKLKKAFHAGVHADYLWSSDPATSVAGKPRRIAADFKNQLMVPMLADTAGVATALCVTNAAGLLNAEGKAAAVGDADLTARAEANFARRRGYWFSLLGVITNVGALLLIYALFAVIGRRAQRWLTLGRTVRRFEQAGGRVPVTAPVDPGLREDAVRVHHTVYAMTFRRMIGWAIDQALFAGAAGLVFAVVMSSEPRVTVTMSDGQLVHGTLIDWRADEVEFTNEAGATVTLPLRRATLPVFVNITSGDSEPTTLPSGAVTHGWAFLKQLVRVSLDTGEEWYGTLDVAHDDENTVALKYTADQYRKTREAFIADLRWRFGADPARLSQEVIKWTTANPPPPTDGIGEHKFPARTAEVTEIIYPPSNGELAIFILAVLIAAWLYETLQISSRRQATVGMRIVGVMRTGLHGEPLSFRQSSVMWLYRIGSYVAFGLGFIVQPFSARWQTVHDRLSASVVLRRPRPGSVFMPPAAANRWIIASSLAAVPFVVLMALLSEGRYSVAMGSVAGMGEGEEWYEHWDNIGLEIQVKELVLNGASIPVSTHSEDPGAVAFVVEAGAPIDAVLPSSLTITPPERCAEAGCPVGFSYGWDSTDDLSVMTKVASSCSEPAVVASGQPRSEPFNRGLPLVAPATPGRYRLWIEFHKLPGCGFEIAGDERKSHMLTFQVEPIWP